jgi:hypothetical protein
MEALFGGEFCEAARKKGVRPMSGDPDFSFGKL